MPVSFTGIKNLNITSSNHQQFGMYKTPDGDINSGEKDVTYVDISYDVNDDKLGNDHDKYIEALSAAGKFCLINQQKPSNVHLQMKLDKIDNDVIKFTNVGFKLNNQPIALNSDRDIKLYQYLADVTRDRLKNLNEVTDNDKNLLDLTNQGVNQAAMEYFECEPLV